MFKRIFWLSLVVAAGWVIWLRLRQRQDQFAAYAPQFAPPAPFAAPLPPAPPHAPVAAQPSDLESDADSATTTLNDTLTAPATDDEQLVTPSADVSEPADALAAADAVSEPADELGDVVGYCVRCKTKRTISNAHEETTESGRRAARGICPVCGAKMFTFLAMSDEEPADDQQE